MSRQGSTVNMDTISGLFKMQALDRASRSGSIGLKSALNLGMETSKINLMIGSEHEKKLEIERLMKRFGLRIADEFMLAY